VRKAGMEAPPLAGQGGLVCVGSLIAVTALKSSLKVITRLPPFPPATLVTLP